MMRARKKNTGTKNAVTLFCQLFFAVLLLANVPAHALGLPDCVKCSCVGDKLDDLKDDIKEEHDDTKEHITEEFEDTKTWLLEEVFKRYILPPAMKLTEDITATAMQQELIFGTFMDAAQQLRTQRLFQDLDAQAHKDYQPSTGLCKFGTNIRNLAASERYIDITAAALNEWQQKRLAGNVNVAGSSGNTEDKKQRLQQFVARYCDVRDNQNGLGILCENTGAKADTVNRDLDYNGVVDRRATLSIDFTDGNLSADEQDVMALARNLYSHEMMPRMNEFMLSQGKIMDTRALAAKRNIATASFNEIVGQKAQGSPASAQTQSAYMAGILQQLGLRPAEIQERYGERPSYYAQMEVLTKKIYQDPLFYADLYDKPANIERKKVTLQAIDLMQDFDLLQSYLRTEMMLSILLEIELIRQQSEVQARIDVLTKG